MITSNELGQNNMWAKEPEMVYQEYNRKGLLTPMQMTEMYNGRWAMMGIIAGAVSYAATGKLFFGIFWHLTMTSLCFTIISVAWFVLLAASVEKICETY